MIRRRLAALLWVVSVQIYSVCEAQESKAQRLDQQVQLAVAEHDFRGAVLVVHQGNVLLRKAYGLADLDSERANSVDTPFLIGSLTKSFTAVLILRLAQDNRIDLHAPLLDYIPDLAPAIAEGLTLHYLLKHQTGLPSHLERLVTFEDKGVSSQDILAIINTATPDFAPGQQYRYSNLNYHLAAIAAENVTGQDYVSLIARYIAQPLGLTSTGVERHDSRLPLRANGYRSGWFGTRHDENIMSYALGSGDIYSTLDDLYRWEQALADEAFLSKASQQALFTPASAERGNYGYGFRIQPYQRGSEHPTPGTLTRHGGSMNGFLANLHRYTDDNLTVIVLANKRPFPIRDLTYRLKEIALDLPATERKNAPME
ncbi:beta-lactamase family protein [Aestuariibacter halophilus]|uniref:Beta-lactamase family protein n=1 Tax=Fluctibacter halophilus TaxID=226011 RepID=A0ABS8G729_9ALTE|nr:serine hydrolase domain-containing protein [Aestuariibacter halophilus]MCC2616218.1 beta-lactamase family protein [Aestuariibacter halophilus]